MVELIAKPSATESFPARVSPGGNSSPTTVTSQIITTTTTLVTGEEVFPDCAYIVASDMDVSPLYSLDYCDCGGTVAPLLSFPASRGGTWTTNCNYTTQPVVNSCPEPLVTITGNDPYFPPSPSPGPMVEVTVYIDPICTSTLGEGETCGYTSATSWTTIKPAVSTS